MARPRSPRTNYKFDHSGWLREVAADLGRSAEAECAHCHGTGKLPNLTISELYGILFPKSSVQDSVKLARLLHNPGLQDLYHIAGVLDMPLEDAGKWCQEAASKIRATIGESA